MESFQVIKKTPVAQPQTRTAQTTLQEISRQMYLRNRELAETNKTLSLLRTIDALVLESHTSLTTVCGHIAQAIVQTTDYAFVGLLTRPSRSKAELTLHGYSGSSLLGKNQPFGLTHSIQVGVTNDWFDSQSDTLMISLDDLTTEEMASKLGCPEAALASIIEQIPLKSLYVIKLQARRHLVGLLVVGSLSPASQIVEGETMLIDQVSDSIGVALDNKLLFEENQDVLRQLKISNAKLKALDEAKDEFISMASHQLRTPLTSIKGYLSMVIEGDAGQVNEQQKSMLSQAFFSSQRMVYLISDLLNVSRLKTGTFVIERRLVNLATMVREEMDQLKETAKTRQLTINYKQPTDFPALMLDETKTRQVVMNFIDNALYYTPAGGQIKVELRETDKTVELHVIDDGMGVPKAELPHLFTKFYRAGNARQARPDGTGLGLYMAKKVIVAEGGSILLSSVEGKGSDFGFVFSKSLAATPDPLAPVVELPVPPEAKTSKQLTTVN